MMKALQGESCRRHPAVSLAAMFASMPHLPSSVLSVLLKPPGLHKDLASSFPEKTEDTGHKCPQVFTFNPPQNCLPR